MADISKASTIITGGGVISQRLIDVAYKMGVRNIYGARLGGHITKKPLDIRVVAWDHHT